jgi:nitrate/nitrite-specific signal transduction histidine kinase
MGLFQLISQDIQDRGAEVRDILRKGNKLLDTLPPSKHTKELAEKLEDIKAEWEELNRQAYQRAQQIDASQKHAQNFQDQLDKILLWLSMDDEKLAGIVPKSLDKDVIARKLKDAQVIKNE